MLSTTLNFVYFFGFLSCAWLGKKDSTFWSVTQLIFMGEQVAIYQIKEESQAFHMSPKTQQLNKKPANYGLSLIHNGSCLVLSVTDTNKDHFTFVIPDGSLSNDLMVLLGQILPIMSSFNV